MRYRPRKDGRTNPAAVWNGEWFGQTDGVLYGRAHCRYLINRPTVERLRLVPGVATRPVPKSRLAFFLICNCYGYRSLKTFSALPINILADLHRLANLFSPLG